MNTNSSSGSESVGVVTDVQYYIALRNVGLRFLLVETKSTGFKEAMLNRVFWRRTKTMKCKREFWALRDIDLDVSHGERLGIIGRNGAGKSTLLKLLAGIFLPTTGRLEVAGRIAPLIELGAGFNQELSARENILLYGSLLGYTRREMEGKTDRILAFSELEDFADVSVKYYSSGMLQRLGFSLATDILPEILLIDEVFSTGDASFVRKARDRMMTLVGDSNIMLLVSHNLQMIRETCTRTIWVDGGRIAADGEPAEVCEAYLAGSGLSDVAAKKPESRPRV